METETSPVSNRGAWRSRIGFILAASGSAIGLGNIVFFSANAYQYGGGAFYLPYLVGLIVLGIPVMIVEFGLGHHTGRSFPSAMRHVAGGLGEFVGWLALANAFIITCYYLVILSWVLGMLGGSLGWLWAENPPPPWPGLEGLGNPHNFFFTILSSFWPIALVLFVWFLNVILVRRGASTIESAVRIFVPLMWVLMIVLIIRGLTFQGGSDGVMVLFSPDFSLMADPAVWRGAFSQIFFTLTLGFGVMTTYASYLPRKSDQARNALTTSLLNCGFEYIAGVAIFAILFAFTVLPKASTVSMMFFVTPTGIGQFPPPTDRVFGVLFFALLFFAGLSSSISLVEGVLSAFVDKFNAPRRVVGTVLCIVGCVGSVLFALPQVVNPSLSDNGTLGLNLLDLMDHWAFGYGLLFVGFLTCLLIGWVYGFERIRQDINQTSILKLGKWFNVVVAVVVPILIAASLILSIVNEGESGGIYGFSYVPNYEVESTGLARLLERIHRIALGVAVLFPVGVAALLTLLPSRDEEEA